MRRREADIPAPDLPSDNASPASHIRQIVADVQSSGKYMHGRANWASRIGSTTGDVDDTESVWCSRANGFADMPLRLRRLKLSLNRDGMGSN